MAVVIGTLEEKTIFTVTSCLSPSQRKGPALIFGNGAIPPH